MTLNKEEKKTMRRLLMMTGPVIFVGFLLIFTVLWARTMASTPKPHSITVMPYTPPKPIPPTTTTAPLPPPAPVAETLQQTYNRCSVYPASQIIVIPGGTSWSSRDGTVKISQWHISHGPDILCHTMAHESGHLYAFAHGTGKYLGAPPAGFPDARGPEYWADCVGNLVSGLERSPCPDIETARAILGR